MKYTTEQQAIINQALDIISDNMREFGEALSSPDEVKRFAQLRLPQDDREEFLVIFLNAQNQLIAADVLFQGTLDGAAVYPREVAKAALNHSAAAVIFAHNHPSGDTTPSQADRRITQRLVDGLRLLDIRVLDHVIVGSSSPYSFAEGGLL